MVSKLLIISEDNVKNIEKNHIDFTYLLKTIKFIP
jgi:hypothetical protein